VALGLPVPAGFVVRCAALEEALGHRAANLRDAIRAAGDDSRRGDCAAHAREIVRSVDVAAWLEPEVRARYAELGDASPVAVRSSAAAEDGDAASYAGQQETFLNVLGADSVIERIRACWESFFTERALFYRAERGSLGLGEAAVSGEVTPDHYVLKRDGRLVRETIAAQPFMIRALAQGGTERVPLAPAHGNRRKLEYPVLEQLAEIGCALHDRLGAPQDVEWALDAGELYVLQARPITA
jgi:pyruvate,water dikinase